MPPASPQYTLVGFTAELDWRPLTFLKPVPANRVCNACGLVRKRTALLPCMHVLCDSCYEMGAQECLHLCPLDGNRYEERDVDLKDFLDSDLLSREVKCWNEGSGCQYATAASGIAQHFQRECEHHSVRCPKCSATVLCRDVCAHLRSASCMTSTSPASESELPSDHLDEPALSTSFKRNIERKADGIAAYQRPMAVDISAQGDKLNELFHSMNTLKETLCNELAYLTRHIYDSSMTVQLEVASSSGQLKECLATRSDTVSASLRTMITVEKTLNEKLNATRNDLSQLAAAIEQAKGEERESFQKILQLISGVLRHSATQVTQCEFFVKGLRSLRDTAMAKGWAEYDSERVYLRGYCLSPGVWLLKVGDTTTLALRYTLHKGDMDDAVVWPFERKIRVSVVHPGEGLEGVLEIKPFRNSLANKKPRGPSNKPDNFPLFFYLPDLIMGGYVDNDQLRIKWELLP